MDDLDEAPIDPALEPKRKAPKRKDVFDNQRMTDLTKQWQALMKEDPPKRHEAMPLLEEIIKGCQNMIPQFAQYEGFSRTVDVETLTAAASARIERYLLTFDPNRISANGLFSYLSKCFKNVFRTEASKVNQYRKYFHATGDNLEKFYGEEDFRRYRNEALEEVKSDIKELTCRWGDLQEIGALRFILTCLVEEREDSIKETPTTVRERIIRSVSFAWAVSPDMARFLYQWAVYALRDALYHKTSPRFTQQDVLRHAESYTFIPELIDIVGWEKTKELMVKLGGVRLRLPTIQQMGKIHEKHLLWVDIQREGEDPDTIEKIGKRRGYSSKTAQQVFEDMSDVMDHRRMGDHPIFGEPEASPNSEE